MNKVWVPHAFFGSGGPPLNEVLSSRGFSDVLLVVMVIGVRFLTDQSGLGSGMFVW